MPEWQRSCNLLISKILWFLSSALCFHFFPPLGCGYSNPGKTRHRSDRPIARRNSNTRLCRARCRFNGLLATALLARKCSRKPLPERVKPKDLARFALATQKLRGAITKDKVMSALRAPFTEVKGNGRQRPRITPRYRRIAHLSILSRHLDRIRFHLWLCLCPRIVAHWPASSL